MFDFHNFLFTDFCLILASLFSVALFFVAKMKLRIEEALPLSTLSIVAFLYIFGIFDLLKIGFHILNFSILFLLIWGIFLARKEKKIFAENFFSPGLLIYTLWCLAIYLLYGNSSFSHHDDFNHWALVSKNTFSLDAIAVGQKSNTLYQDYPPATALMQYWISKICGYFSDSAAFFSMSLLGFSFLIYPLKNLQWKSYKITIIYFFFGILMPVIFRIDEGGGIFFYQYLMVDYLLAIMFGYALILATNIDQNFSKFSLLNLILTLCILTIVKKVGIFLAFLAMTLAVYNILKSGKKIEFFKIKSKFSDYKIETILCFLLPLIITILSWKFFLQYNSAPISYVNRGFSKTVDNLFTFDLEFPKRAGLVFEIYLRAFYGLPITSGGIQFGFLAFILFISFGAYILYKIQKDENVKRKIFTNYLIIFSFFFIYLLGHLLMYLFVLSDGESYGLSSFHRYLLFFSAGIFFFIIGVLFDRAFKKNDESAKILVIALMAATFLMGNPTFIRSLSAKDQPPEMTPKQRLIMLLEKDQKSSDPIIREWSNATLKNVRIDHYEPTANEEAIAIMGGIRRGVESEGIETNIKSFYKIIKEYVDVNDVTKSVCFFEGIPGYGYGYAMMVRNKVVPLRVERFIALENFDEEQRIRHANNFKEETKNCSYIILVGVNDVLRKNYKQFFKGQIIENGFYINESKDGNVIFALKDCSICKK